ncbi:thioesterase domain-containing protein [Streptomyces netropsis]
MKVRGYRVEPAEAELALTELAARQKGAHVREAAVVARKDTGGQTALVAFLVGDADRTDTRRLSTGLRTVLPDFMVPTHWEWLPALPLTPSGKRDDKALRAVALSQAGSRGGTPPRDAYERALVEMLADLLGGGPVGIHDDIFACGATSITVMRLVVLIEQRYDVAIGLSRFIAAPTVAALADLLRAGHAAAAFDPLVPIRTSGSRRPLFLTHPMGGNVLCYLPLARHLPEDQPLYAFQAAGAEPGTEPLRTLPEIAASYIAAMRRVQPTGPYLIGGWSFGGFVAFEMARQLRAAGEETARVILLDTVAVGPDARRGAYTDEALLGWFFWELLWLRRGAPHRWPSSPRSSPRWTRSSPSSPAWPSVRASCPPTAPTPWSAGSSRSTPPTGVRPWTTGRNRPSRTSSCCGRASRCRRFCGRCTAPPAPATPTRPTDGAR